MILNCSSDSTKKAKHGAVYELFTGNTNPIHVVCCGDQSDGFFPHASNLLFELIGDDDKKKINFHHVSMTTTDQPQEVQDIIEIVNTREIFKDFGNLTIGVIPGEAAEEDFLTVGVGVGSNWKKCERGAKLALAMTLALRGSSADTWMRKNDITINVDPWISPNEGEATVSGGCGAPKKRKRSSSYYRPEPAISGIGPNEEGNRTNLHRMNVSGSANKKRSMSDPYEGDVRKRTYPSREQIHLVTENPSRTPKGSVLMEMNPDESLKKKKQKLAVLMNACHEQPERPWVLVYHPERRLHYYWNVETHEQQWHAPQD